MVVISWACECEQWANECEQVNPKESFLDNFIELDKNKLTHGIEYLVTWTNILPCVHGWTIIIDEK
jgi:hypothetical protein